jgi:hypothetical protein
VNKCPCALGRGVRQEGRNLPAYLSIDFKLSLLYLTLLCKLVPLDVKETTMTGRKFGAVMTAATIVAIAVTWWDGRVLGQTRAVAADAPAAASVQTITVYRVTAGDYVIQGGVIVPFGQQPPVPPDDPVDPPVPDDASKLTADLIKALPASNTRHENAIKLAGTLKLLADQTKEKKLDADTIAKVYSPLMAVAVPDNAWKHIHAAILAGLKACPSPAVCAATLEQYAAGAMSTVPNQADPKIVRGVSSDEVAAAAEEYGFNWATILNLLLPILLKLLEQWLSFVQVVGALLC